MNDLKFALRQLLKNPGFTAVAVLTLALGIGANTAIFSEVNAVLMRPLPYAQPERIVAIWDSRGQPGSMQRTTLPRNFQFWREHSRSFSALALAERTNYRLESAEEIIGGLDGAKGATAGVGMEVTPNLFALLGVAALRGRPLVSGDEVAGTSPVVLSHGLWQRGFGGGEGVLGRTVKLNNGACTVVGIMPPQFVFPPRVSLASAGEAQDCDLWVPMAINQRRLQTSGRN